MNRLRPYAGAILVVVVSALGGRLLSAATRPAAKRKYSVQPQTSAAAVRPERAGLSVNATARTTAPTAPTAPG